MKENINEELGYIKYLFDYKKGRVISEQNNKYGGEDAKYYEDDIKGTGVQTTDVDATTTLRTSNTEPEKQKITKTDQSSENKPTQQQTSTQELPSPEIKISTDVVNKKQELETELQNINKSIELVTKQQEFAQKQKYIDQLTTRLEMLDKKLEYNCSSGLRLFKGCRRYRQEQKRIREDIEKLMGVVEEKPESSGKGKDPTYWSNWILVATGLLGLLGTIIGAIDKFKKDDSSSSGAAPGS